MADIRKNFCPNLPYNVIFTISNNHGNHHQHNHSHNNNNHHTVTFSTNVMTVGSAGPTAVTSTPGLKPVLKNTIDNKNNKTEIFISGEASNLVLNRVSLYKGHRYIV